MGYPLYNTVVLDDLLARSQFPSIKIHPLFCSGIEILEEITGVFKNASLPQILNHWQSADSRMLLPLQAVDLTRFGLSEKNDWLLAEWNAIYKSMVRILFPDQDIDAL